MKKTRLIGFVFIAITIGIAGFYACEKTYVEPNAPTEILESPKLVLAPAIWKITTFQWKNKSDNNHFVSYSFIFNQDGTIDAIHDNIKEYGKYSKQENVLAIRFLELPLAELNNKWTISDHTTIGMTLRGLSPDDNSSEFLMLEKVKHYPPGETEGKLE